MPNLIEEIGGPTAVARMVGCKPPSVIGWRKNGIPAERSPAIERGTAGRFVCEQLCPAVHWHRVPDPDWPWHPAGRPLIDVTRKSPAKQMTGVPSAEPKVRDVA